MPVSRNPLPLNSFGRRNRTAIYPRRPLFNGKPVLAAFTAEKNGLSLNGRDVYPILPAVLLRRSQISAGAFTLDPLNSAGVPRPVFTFSTQNDHSVHC